MVSCAASTPPPSAGLTLTVASTAFILEPCLNPGLEAQAAARIHRLGQGASTRVVRLLASDTVEQNVLRLQQHKLTAGGVADRQQRTGGQGQAGAGAGGSGVRGGGAAGGREGSVDPAMAEAEASAAAVEGTADIDGGVLLEFFGDL